MTPEPPLSRPCRRDNSKKLEALAGAFAERGCGAYGLGGRAVLAEGAVVGALRPDLSARVITHSATTAVALADHPGVDVFMLGGRLHKRSVSALGAVAAEAARAVSADLALLVLAGVHPEAGLTAGEAEEAALRRILISRTADTYVLASIEKLGTVCPTRSPPCPRWPGSSPTRRPGTRRCGGSVSTACT